MPTLFFHVFLFLITTSVIHLLPTVDSNCIESQKQSLLHFKESLVFDSIPSSKLITWNSSTDCCFWLGVTCSTDGRVVGLDLSSESISCSINSSSSLFQLEHLQSLNLAFNNFYPSSIPAAIGKLADLRYLNLSSTYFSRQIPIEFARLTRLVTLDLSGQMSPSFEVENPNLGVLIQNLTELTELNFDMSLDLSAQGSDWCEAVSSSLPNLRVLRLSRCGIYGPICESLAKLQSLYEIDLSLNSFNAPVPRFFANLSYLTYMSLSASDLVGTFPIEILQIPSLQTIDLSNNDDLQGSFPEFSNNGSLRSLIVASTSFSGELPNSIGNLKMLSTISLSHCSFTGVLPNSIGNLTQLVELDISWNRFSSPISSIHWENLVNLESLDLSNNQLYGTIPSSIVSSPLLVELALSNSFNLSTFPDFFRNQSSWSLTLDLSDNQIQGQIPNWIWSLSSLQDLYLSSNSLVTLEAPLPNSTSALSSLTLNSNKLQDMNSSFSFLQLDQLEVASNNLTTFPDFLRNQSKLTTLDLSDNQIQGQIPNWIWSLSSLQNLYLSSNSLVTLEAPLPNSTSALSSLTLNSNKLQDMNSSFSFLQLDQLEVASNNLTTFPDFLRNQSQLITLDLSDNQIQGQIPNWIWSLSSLQNLDLSSNSLVTLEAPLPNSTSALSTLTLNSNKLQDMNSSFSFLQLDYLDVASNNLTTFPDFLRNQSQLITLDLSDNQIQGQIPNWIWSCSHGALNLSSNSLNDLQAPLHNSTHVLKSLDLHSNQLQGQIPVFLSGIYVDYSRNHFTSSIPNGILISGGYFLSLSSNDLVGAIPKSICKASLMVLDLSNNSLSGNIPQCLTQVYLSVLDLSRNNLTGTIPDNFPEGCEIKTLDLSRNQIQGKFPKSLVHCSRLVVLNLANNYVTDSFPCTLMNICTLRVLVLRSNKFYGRIGCLNTNGTWSVLQVIDLAHNSFSGDIAGRMFMNWHAMMSNEDDSPTNLEFFHKHWGVYSSLSWEKGFVTYKMPGLHGDVYYRDTITAIIKGLEFHLVKIPNIFTLIDFSSNKFNGPIPEEIGELKSLYAVNLSNNAFTGRIPSSFGQMQQLESLDLSNNQLSGQIPQQMVKLSFLAVLDLANNQLVGKIPTSTQFSTFPNTSFQGNKGLWGPPLTTDALSPPPASNGSLSPPNSGNEIDWDIISAEIGFTCGFGLAVGSLLFCKRWRKWYYRAMRSLLFKIFPQLEQRFGVHRRHVYLNMRR